MSGNITVAVKPGTESAELLNLARSVASPNAAFLLVSIVIVRSEVDGREVMPAIRQELEAFASQLDDEGFTASVRTEFATVGAGARVAAIAEEEGAELLVIGLAKRTRVGKALLGSDAQTIILTAHCPVLSVRLK